MTNPDGSILNEGVEKISTEDMAALIVDALLRSNIVSAADVERALLIAREEIQVRKTLGDY
jgi:hypothetical protein